MCYLLGSSDDPGPVSVLCPCEMAVSGPVGVVLRRGELPASGFAPSQAEEAKSEVA